MHDQKFSSCPSRIRGSAVLSERDLGDRRDRTLQLNAIDTGAVLWRTEVLRAEDRGIVCINDDGDIFLLTDKSVVVYRVRRDGRTQHSPRYNTFTLTMLMRDC